MIHSLKCPCPPCADRAREWAGRTTRVITPGDVALALIVLRAANRRVTDAPQWGINGYMADIQSPDER